jgi:hypothetical protein
MPAFSASTPVAPISDSTSPPAPTSPPPPPPAPAASSGSEQQAIPDSRPIDLSAPAPSAPAPEPALPNGDFDNTTDGWDGENAALSLVPGVDGNGVRVAHTTTTDSFSFYAEKKVVSRKARMPFKVGAYVRSTSPGMLVCLRAEEHTSGRTITTERCAPMRKGWKRIRVHSRTTAKGTQVVFSIHVMAALGGRSFDVDGFQLGGLS